MFVRSLLIIAISTVVPSMSAAEPIDLPLSRIVAYSAGVAFCEHSGTVDGDGEAVLEFPVENISDVLKSLVVLDLDGGKTSLVTYDNREPIARSLAALRVDLAGDVSFAALLEQLRGEQVELRVDGAKINPVPGKIVGVETSIERIENTTTQHHSLLLLGDGGLQSIALSDVRLVRFVDKELDADFQRGLELLAATGSNDQRSIRLRFRGEGKRRVRVGYIREFPVWKTSYRLVLKDDDKALLQGWAIIENTTLDDWNNVELALVSGRPISFRMDLYEPLYVERPEVVPDLFAGLAPRVYDQDLGGAKGFGGRPPGMGGGGFGGGAFGGGGAGMGGFGGGGGSFGGTPEQIAAARERMAERLDDNLLDSTESMVNSGEVGELFRYEIDQPVTLEREHSAMVPIIGSEVPIERLSIYNASVNEKHPLNGLRLTNSTDLDWMQGPVAVFDGGEFAGDARLGHVPPDAERLVSYALDLETEVNPKRSPEQKRLVSATLVDLALNLVVSRERTTDYIIKNSATKPKQVLIEQKIDGAWKLQDEELAVEQTRSLYRFAVDVASQATATLAVAEAYRQKQTIAIESMSNTELAKYLKSPEITESVKESLRTYAKRKTELADIRSAEDRVREQLIAIAGEQDRIRRNMQSLDRTSELYQRYADKLNEQESNIEKLRADANELARREAEAEAAMLKGGN